MIAVGGTYENGYIKLDKEVSSKNPVKIIVTFLGDVEEQQPTEKRLTLDDFSFRESQKLLADYKGSFSDEIIEERRSAL